MLAALEMQTAMQELNHRRVARSQVACELGIGLHCGEVLHGFIGSADRMEFTVIGDAVNRTSRFCSGANGGEIIISPEMYERVWRQFDAEVVAIPTKHEGDFQAYLVRRPKTAGA